MNPVEAATFFPLLDEIDSESSKESHDGEYWARCLYGDHISHWKYNFPAFAVANSMCGYVNHRLSRAKAFGTTDHFLNGKDGRPLLHFSAFHGTPSPEMTQLLIDSGANIEAKFENKTAIQSLVLPGRSIDGGSSLGVMKVLLNKGASPNSRYYPTGDTEKEWFPLIHIIAGAGDYDWGEEAKLSFLHLLLDRQVDPNGRDWKGLTFIEVLYWHGRKLPQDQWVRLFEMGGRITKKMICAPDVTTGDGYDGHIPITSRPASSFWPEISIRSLRSRRSRNRAQRSDLSSDSDQEIDTSRPGLCDQSDGGHDAYVVLRQKKFRVKEWYDKDARKEAKRRSPHWFTEFEV
ncbi:ankyrin repeat [Fusarium mundagurra]|uniref:Ankyrin repeat n=1 Tax=Fusarium mundagurra TaxID=1567541 RepID=A0A8H5YPA0_9HYPO|nr:ankyrin repeat [Fusarium mundagurra]